MHNIHVGDVLQWARNYSGEPFHALLCDPPYELKFMNKGWDGTGIAFQPETWAALAEHLYPGAFIMAFGGSRGFHRMAVAIEDAGLIIHPTITYLFGSGFPKSTSPSMHWRRQRHGGTLGMIGNYAMVNISLTKRAEWLRYERRLSGHRYGGQALKPASEFIVVAQKPYANRPVDDITATGAGVLNVDAGRIEHNEPETYTDRTQFNGTTYAGRLDGSLKDTGISSPSQLGRWPANLVISHTPDCTYTANGWQCADGCPVRVLGEQTEGTRSSKPSASGSGTYNGSIWGSGIEYKADVSNIYHDSGTAARFFFNADYLLERLEDTAPFLYASKADKWQREAGLLNAEYPTVGDGRQKSIDNAYQRGETKRRNIHPTVKSLELTRWLAALLLPPDAYAPRRLLVPFAGSGSEMIGALLAGWDGVQGIEQSTEYAAIAWQRLAFWQDYAGLGYEKAREYAEAKAELEARQANTDAPLDDLPLFGFTTS